MDIIAIKSKTFEQMKERFKGFSNQVKDLCGDNQDKEQWLGNEDVCALLQISLRTLQSYRDSGMLPFSLIGRKCYYRVSDMQQLIDNSKRNPDERKNIHGRKFVRFKCVGRQLGKCKPESDYNHIQERQQLFT